MTHFASLALALALLPLLASAQAIKCHDPATGKTLYTDQPCKGGELVVPPRTEEEIRRDAEAAAQAREDALQREQIALERERLRLQAAQAALAERAQQSPAESETCRAARAEASFRAASFGSPDNEQLRTARYNAALACGQQPPADIVTVQPYAPAFQPYYNYPYDYNRLSRPAVGSGFGNRPATPPLPANPPARPAPAPKSQSVAAPMSRSIVTPGPWR